MPRSNTKTPVEKRFWAKVDKDGPLFGDSPCWIWTACKQPNGYGKFGLNYKTKLAHRVAYELLIGAIPEGMTVDHLCFNRACVNPLHMDICPMGVNTGRSPHTLSGMNIRKSHCVHGHEFTESNTRLYKGIRYCMTCTRSRWKAHYYRTNRNARLTERRRHQKLAGHQAPPIAGAM